MRINEKRPYTKREGLNILSNQMKLERLSHEQAWKDIAEVTLPYSPQWLTYSTNRGERLDNEIMDSTATQACGTLAAGMMAGITSPAREWFQLTVSDPDIAEVHAVKEWLDIVTDRMRTVFLQANLYESCPAMYEDLGVFGISPMFIERDPDTVINTRVFQIGSYWVSSDRKGRVNTFYREYRMTIRNLVEEFGGPRAIEGDIDWSKFSTHVYDEWRQNHMETWVDVCHLIYPNPDYHPNSRLSKHRKYASCYYELGRSSSSMAGGYTTEDDDKFLRESGYDIFPVLCPRWKTAGEDTYAKVYPGRTALGDTRQLQHGETRKMQGVDQVMFPPTTAPNDFKRVKIGALGEVTYYGGSAEQNSGYRPLYQIQPDFAALDGMQEGLRNRIRRIYFEDLFLMMLESDRRQVTAEEIRVRQQEKLLRVGPVLEQLNKSFLDPLIEITFHHMLSAGMLDDIPAPDELQNRSITVQYVSIMAQAQKAIGLSSYHELSGFVVNLSEAYPQIFDVVNVDEMVNQVSTALGVSPKVLNPPEKFAAIREQRSRQQQAQVAAEQAATGAGAVKDLAGASLEGDSALSRLLEVAKTGQLVPAR